MKYFIGYLIQGEAAEWHSKTTEEISERFNTWKLHEKIPSHVTIFQPFEIDNIQPMIEELEVWSKSIKSDAKLIINDFDHFGDSVIFAKVDASTDLIEAVAQIKNNLKALPNMPQEDFPVWHPHATIANRLEPETIRSIWEYVSTLEKPNFIIPFDNVTLFSYRGDRAWEVNRIFPIS